MKIKLFFLILIIFSGCKNIVKVDNQKNADQLISKSELSPQINNNLPLGFRFGFSSKKVNLIIDSLRKKNIITKFENEYDYEYYIGNNIQKSSLDFIYNKDKLYILRFNFLSILNNIDELERILVSQISKELGLQNTSVSYHFILDNITVWVKDNKSLELKKASGGWMELTYTDNPTNKIISEVRNKEITAQSKNESDAAITRSYESKTEDQQITNPNYGRAQKQSGKAKVEASEWDGSVSQVKKYIKANLNDPDSYKSVQWSVVYDDPNGYKVAHEYRAKNAYGGYVTKKQIFYLNFDGEVTKVTE